MKAEIDASSERIKVIASLALTLRYKEDAEKEFAAGHYDAAYETIRKARETSEKLETKQLGKPGKATATGLITEAWYALFVHQYSEALRASERALAILPQDLAAAINHAHALMLMDRTYEAKAAYLAHRGETIDDKVWRKATKEDFDKLRKVGITHPLMGEIEAAFAPPAPVVEAAPPASSPPVAKAAPPPAPEEAPVWRAAPKAEIFATINTTELKLRACAEFSKQCPEVTRMRQGLRVKVLGDAGNGWVKLLVPADDGKIVEGFCNSKYLQYENNEKIGGGLY
jgi:tetratricopeptide (TPR) repeat protein